MPIKPRHDKVSLNGLLDLARARQGMSSDRELAAALNVGSPAVSNWRYGNSHPSPMTCMRLAELASLPLGVVLGTIGAAYAPNDEEAAVWRKLADEAGGEAAIVRVHDVDHALGNDHGRSRPLADVRRDEVAPASRAAGG